MKVIVKKGKNGKLAAVIRDPAAYAHSCYLKGLLLGRAQAALSTAVRHAGFMRFETPMDFNVTLARAGGELRKLEDQVSGYRSDHPVAKARALVDSAEYMVTHARDEGAKARILATINEAAEIMRSVSKNLKQECAPSDTRDLT